MTLTRREKTVLELVCIGLETKQIARRLHLSPVTVRHVTQSLLQKMNAANRTMLAVKAVCSRTVDVFLHDDALQIGRRADN